MCAVRPEQDTAERSAERKEPVPHPSADRTGRPSDEIGDDDPHLLGEERRADELVGLEVALQGGLSEERGARGPDEVRRDPESADRSGERRESLPAAGAPYHGEPRRVARRPRPDRSSCAWLESGISSSSRRGSSVPTDDSAHGLLWLSELLACTRGTVVEPQRRRSISASRLNRPDPRKATTKARPASARFSW